jgi:hypothetical protein
MRIRALGAAAAVIAVTAAVAAPAVASSPALPLTVVPPGSIAGVHTGEFEAAVRGRLGAPHDIGQANGGSIQQLGYGNGRPGLLITFDPRKHGDPVGMIQASGGDFQTSSGVGIGSTRGAVRRMLPAFLCGARSCVRKSGPVTMSLAIGSHGHVVLITVVDARFQSPLP